jgi:hypothetical protein
MDTVKKYFKTNFGTWPLPLWVQVTITFVIAYAISISMAVYAKDVPTNPTYVLLSAIIIYDGTRGTIKTGMQRMVGTLTGVGIGVGSIAAINAIPPATPFLYTTWKPVVLGIILAPTTGVFIGWSKGQNGFMAYNWYFFKYTGVTICLGSMFVIDTQTGGLNWEYAVSRIIGITIGVFIGSMCSFVLGAPTRRLFRNSLAVIANRVANLIDVTVEGYYEIKSGGSLYEKGRQQAGPLQDAITATTNILSETSTPTLSGLVFRKGGRERYIIALKRLQRCRYHAIYLLFERAEVVDAEKSDRTSLDMHARPLEMYSPPDDLIDHAYYPKDLRPLTRGFQRYLQPGAPTEISTALVDILSHHGGPNHDQHPPDPNLLRDLGKEISRSLKKCADSLKSFPLDLKMGQEWQAADIFIDIEQTMTPVLQRAYIERTKLESVMALSFEDGIPWITLLKELTEVNPSQNLYEFIVLQEYRQVLIRLLRLGFEVLEFSNLIYNVILVPH